MNDENKNVSEEELSEKISEEINEMRVDKATVEEYRQLNALIKEVDKTYATMREATLKSIANFGLSPSLLEGMLIYKEEDFDSMSEDDINGVIKEYGITEEKTNEILEASLEDRREALKNIKKKCNLLMETKLEGDKIKNNGKDVLNEYIQYLSSEKVRESRKKRIDILKESLKEEEDPTHKKEIEKMVNTLENSINFSFVKERFSNYGEKEVDSIMRSYFKDTLGSIMMKKYMNKIVKYGYKKDVYKSFFNIEETFLPEEYHPFNNLFLFIYMRMVSHSDPYNETDKILVQSITGAMADLFYHKFENNESEEFFKSIIIDVLDNFKDKVDYFKENNMTYEKHPYRIQIEQEHDRNRRNSLVKSLERLKITDYDENMSTDELQEFYNKKVEGLIKEQYPEKKETEDGDDKLPIAYINESNEVIESPVTEESETQEEKTDGEESETD